MAGTGIDPQKQLLSLIRNFATEKSQGERRVVTLRKQIETLISDLSVANAELEKTKRCKELVEQDLKGFEVQLFMSEASVQTLEARVTLTKDHVSVVESDLETLKNEEEALREEFIHYMLDLNAEIRKFQENIITCDNDAVERTASRELEYTCVERGDYLLLCLVRIQQYISSADFDPTPVIMKENDADVALRDLESRLSEIISQTTKEDEEYQVQQKIYKNVQRELIDFERKVSLMNLIVKETKELQDLTMQSSELEATYNSLAEELQNRSMCPTCHLDNLQAFRELLGANEEK